MKAGTTAHIKFKRLMRELRLTEWQTVGVLESLWMLTSRSHVAGDIGVSENADIAIGIGWEDDEDVLINALVKTGWLDESNYYRLTVHNWERHCPNYIKGNMAKYGKSFAEGSPRDTPKETPRDTPMEAPRDAPMDAPTKPILFKPSQANITIPSTSVAEEKADIKIAWNIIADKHKNFKRVQSMTDSRLRSFRARVKENPNFLSVIETSISESRFLRGETTDFKFTFDWMIKPANFLKVVEGNYEDGKPDAKLDDEGNEISPIDFSELTQKQVMGYFKTVVEERKLDVSGLRAVGTVENYLTSRRKTKGIRRDGMAVYDWHEDFRYLVNLKVESGTITTKGDQRK